MFSSFLIGELFHCAKGDVDLQQKDINGKGTYFINSGLDNRGIKGKTDRPAKVFPANTITIDFWGNAYYRDLEYKLATHNHVLSLSGNVIKNKQVGLYLEGALSKLSSIFSYDNMATWNRLKALSIELPVIESSDPEHKYTVDDINYGYMQEHITELEQERITELDAYLQASGLDDYELNAEDKEVLSLPKGSTSFEADAVETDIRNEKIAFKEFVYSDLFRLLPQAFKVSKREFSINGRTPAYSSETSNNGCLGYVNRDPLFQVTRQNPVYVIFGDHTRTMNIVHESFCVMDNVKVLTPRERMSDEVLFYITTAWKKAIPNLGYSRHWSIAKNVKFLLPVKSSPDQASNKAIDFDYMEHYIRAIEKLAIADVVKYKNQVIATTKQVIARQ